MSRPWDRYVDPADLRVFESAGYGRRAGLSGSPALVVVDVNNGFLGDAPEDTLTSIARFRNSCGPVGWAAIRVIERLLDTARQASHPVVFTTGRDDDRDIQAATWATKSSRVLEEYDTGIREYSNALPEVLGVRADEPVVRKSHASAFFGTRLDIHLRSLGVDQLVVCGTATSGCVRASVVDAFSLGYRVAVVGDGCFDRSDLSHAVSLFDIDQKYADVVDGAEALAFLATGSGSEPGSESGSGGSVSGPVSGSGDRVRR